MIPVTKTYLPPINDYMIYLQKVWDAGWVTNNGMMLRDLETKLADYFDNKNFIIVNNGTIALQIAVKALELKGEVITTPFSYVATSSSLFWEGCTPVFADIEQDYFTLNPEDIEKAITPNTSGILATHVYGNPCDVDAINGIAAKHDLKVVYDAAHCFGVKYKNIPLVNFGDASIISFHATKLFHTVEGGGLFTHNPEVAARFAYMRNFGHNGEEDFFGAGINGKNSEIHAAMGLCVMDNIDLVLAKRKEQFMMYFNFISTQLPELQLLKIREFTDYNYAYFPVVFPDEKTLLYVRTELQKHNVFPRRYFYPPLNKLNYLKNKPLPVSDSISPRVVCLPLYHDLKNTEIEMICDVLHKSLKCNNTGS